MGWSPGPAFRTNDPPNRDLLKGGQVPQVVALRAGGLEWIDRRAARAACRAEVAELVDATVSKTVAPQGACRFDPGLRHQVRCARCRVV